MNVNEISFPFDPDSSNKTSNTTHHKNSFPHRLVPTMTLPKGPLHSQSIVVQRLCIRKELAVDDIRVGAHLPDAVPLCLIQIRSPRHSKSSYRTRTLDQSIVSNASSSQCSSSRWTIRNSLAIGNRSRCEWLTHRSAANGLSPLMIVVHRHSRR